MLHNFRFQLGAGRRRFVAFMSIAAISEPDQRGQVRERALEALRGGRLGEAARLAQQALLADPGDGVAAQALGHALVREGRGREAVEALRAPAARSQDPALETLFARALAMAGRRDEAIEQLRRTTERRPVFVLAFLELAQLLAEAGRNAEAEDVYAEGLALAPEAAVLRLGLGHLCLALNQRGRARELFAEVARAAPHRVDAKLALARVMELDGDYGAAVALYRGALELRGDDPAAQIALGKCLVELGEREAGEAMLKQAARHSAGAAWQAIVGMSATARGRLFLRPSEALGFLAAGAA